MRKEEVMNNIYPIKKFQKISSIISAIGIIVFCIAFLFTTYNLKQKQSDLFKAQVKLDSLNHISNNLKNKIDDLNTTQESLLDFIGTSLSDSSINRIQFGIDWEQIKIKIINLPAGKRKQALLNAILLSWKEIPFSLGEINLRNGFDSPGFIEYILKSVDIKINKDVNLPLSQNIMNTFKMTDTPEIGDLMFYRGRIGSFGLFYLGNKDDFLSEGVGIGTLQKQFPIGVYKYMNTEFFPFIGYFKVNYED